MTCKAGGASKRFPNFPSGPPFAAWAFARAALPKLGSGGEFSFLADAPHHRPQAVAAHGG